MDILVHIGIVVQAIQIILQWIFPFFPPDQRFFVIPFALDRDTSTTACVLQRDLETWGSS